MVDNSYAESLKSESRPVFEPSVALTRPSVPKQFNEYVHVGQAWIAGWYAGVSRAIATVRSVRMAEALQSLPHGPEPAIYADRSDTVFQAEARLHGDMAGYQAYMNRKLNSEATARE